MLSYILQSEPNKLTVNIKKRCDGVLILVTLQVDSNFSNVTSRQPASLLNIKLLHSFPPRITMRLMVSNHSHSLIQTSLMQIRKTLNVSKWKQKNMIAICGEDEEGKCSFYLQLKRFRINFLVPIYFLKYFLGKDISCLIMLFREPSLLLGPERVEISMNGGFLVNQVWKNNELQEGEEKEGFYVIRSFYILILTMQLV